jgi:hypothetical protein
VIVSVFHGEVVTACDITGWRPETPEEQSMPSPGWPFTQWPVQYPGADSLD